MFEEDEDLNAESRSLPVRNLVKTKQCFEYKTKADNISYQANVMSLLKVANKTNSQNYKPREVPAPSKFSTEANSVKTRVFQAERALAAIPKDALQY